MESERRDDEPEELVRCLDCGTLYEQPSDGRDVEFCPNCGYVGWIALSTEQPTRKGAD